jgi:hypothetical protein
MNTVRSKSALAIAAFACAITAVGIGATYDVAKEMFYAVMLIVTMFVGIVTPTSAVLLFSLVILSGCVIAVWMLERGHEL